MLKSYLLFLNILALVSCKDLVHCTLTIHNDIPKKQLVDGQINVQYTDHISVYVSPIDSVYCSDIELIGAPAGIEVHFSPILSSTDTYFFVFTGTPIESGNFTFKITYTSNIKSNGYDCSKTKMSGDIYLNIQP